MHDLELTTESSHDRPIGPRGALLTQLLEHAHLSQSEIARQVYVDAATISNLCLDRWVPGKSACTRDTIMAIAQVLLQHGAPWPETMTWVVACGYSPFPPGEWPSPSFLDRMDPDLREAALEAADIGTEQSLRIATLVRAYMAGRDAATKEQGA